MALIVVYLESKELQTYIHENTRGSWEKVNYRCQFNAPNGSIKSCPPMTLSLKLLWKGTALSHSVVSASVELKRNIYLGKQKL